MEARWRIVSGDFLSVLRVIDLVLPLVEGGEGREDEVSAQCGASSEGDGKVSLP